MIIKGATKQQIYAAMNAASPKFDGNLAFDRFDAANTRDDRYNVTLRVLSSKGKGARRSWQGRRMPKACWHAHGEFFNALPEGTIVVSNWGSDGSKKETVCHGGRTAWRDFSVGSMMYPAYMSETCECEGY